MNSDSKSYNLLIATSLAIVVVAIQVTTVESCSCDYPNFRAQFCRSKYAALVQIGGPAQQFDDSNYAAYSMDVKNIMKSSSEGEQALRSNVLWTKRRRSSCNVQLIPSATYVIFGDITSDGRVIVSMCNAMDYESLTDEERKEIGFYLENGIQCR